MFLKISKLETRTHYEDSIIAISSLQFVIMCCVIWDLERAVSQPNCKLYPLFAQGVSVTDDKISFHTNGGDAMLPITTFFFSEQNVSDRRFLRKSISCPTEFNPSLSTGRSTLQSQCGHMLRLHRQPSPLDEQLNNKVQHQRESEGY